MAQYSDSSKTETVYCENSRSTNVDDSPVKSITNEIIRILQLEDDENKNQIVNNLLENGRQSLVKYQDDIIPEVYETEMSGKDNKLMNLLRQYFQQQWETEYGVQNDWFISFLKEYRNGDKNDSYRDILNRTAEYGNKFMKDYPVLSIVFQLLFESIDDQTLNESNMFDDLWSTITNEGLKSITKYSEHISKELLDTLINREQLILFQALREYFRPKLFQLLEESKVRDHNKLYELALDHVAENGWLTGLQAVKNKIAPKHFVTLMEKIPSPLKEHKTTLDAQENGAPLTNQDFDEREKSQSSTCQLEEELNIIQGCVFEQSNLFQLVDLVKAGELQYMNQTLKQISEKLVNDFQNKRWEFSEFVQNCLTPIMYLLKRLQGLDDFVRSLTFKYQKWRQKTHHRLKETTSLSLRMLLHILLMNSDIFLRRIIISLASKRNPIPFVLPNIYPKDQDVTYEFVPAIIHVWEYERPTILSFGVGPCQGKSTLLNQLFQCTFEQTVDSIYFKQTIDIDFGYCFNPERILNIADTHGFIDKKLLRKIQSLFDGFLIQIDENYFGQQSQALLEYLDILLADKFQIVILRDTKNQNSQDYSSKINNLAKEHELELSQKLNVYSIQNVCNTNDRDVNSAIEDLREEILTRMKEDISADEDRKADVLNKLRKLIEKDYVEYLGKTNKIIKPLKNCLLRIDEGKNEENFPLYLKFQELCKIRQKLKKLDFYGSDSTNIFELNKQLFKLESELTTNGTKTSSISCGSVFDLFIEILKSDNVLMSLDLLASELKYELSSLGGNKLAGNLAVQHAFLSLEVLWRNSIVCYEHTTVDNQNLITEAYTNFVAAGFPFEIIDGDNFHFQHQFLSKILNRFANERILVISIIGPQNSGKSTLLNYMFGTLFDVREGRCTRGIYASLVKLDKADGIIKSFTKKSQHDAISDVNYIMLIDTEGLLSIEKGDQEYDRRLVLFSLAISHLVIVNMMGDINETLKDMLTLCADSLKQIGVNTTNQPIVHFVLNQKADPNIKNHEEAITIIVNDLREKGLGGVIDISTETFHTLPSAFKKERASNDSTSPCFLRTEPDFIDRTQQLCEKIIESAMSSYQRSGNMVSDPPQWLRTAVNIFDTLQKFPDLTYFKDINERRQDDQIRAGIRDLISKTLTADYREKIIKDTSELTERKIRKQFQARFDDHQNNFDDSLEAIFKITSASERIRDRCRQFLKRQVTEICNAWCIAAIHDHDKKQMISLVRDGAADLRSLIDQIINRGKTMTREAAIGEFEDMWKKKVKSIEKSFDPEERLKQAINFVYVNYNIFEKQCLPSHEHILQSLQFINELCQTTIETSAAQIQNCFNNEILELRQDALEFSRERSDVNVTYTLATLQNFQHLNKQILTDLHAAGSYRDDSALQPTDHDKSNEKSSRKQEAKSSKHSIMRRGFHAVTNVFGYGTTSTEKLNSPTNPIPLKFDLIQVAHDTIWNEMNSTSNMNSNILNIREFFDKIVTETIEIVRGNSETCRPIEIDIVQKIVGLINTKIHEVNLELAVFRLLLSIQTKSQIHSSILILLATFYYKEQKDHFTQQLSTLNSQKASLLNYFISLVVPDAECYKQAAKDFACQVKAAIQSSFKRDAQSIMRRVEAKPNLNRKDIQTICDGKLLAATLDDDWLLRYIDAPTDIITEEFNILWEEIAKTVNQQLVEEKIRWKTILMEFFHHLELMMYSLANQGPSVQYVDDIFEASGGVAEVNLKNKGQCMVLLLSAYLSGDSIQTETSYTVFGKSYKLKSKGMKLFEKLQPPSPQLAKLIKEMKDAYSSNGNQLAVASIKNLHVFLQATIDVKTLVEEDFDRTPTTFKELDIDQIYNKLLDKARGCTSKCPCCARPCDADHTLTKSNAGDEDNRHSCQTGHQLRAMAGIKFDVSNEASLFQCEQMKDDQLIIVRGMKKKWSKFKKDHPDWDFGNSITPDDLFKLRGKFLHVWSRIGEKLCEKYQMKFVQQNTSQATAKSFHYILLLDASGSMKVGPWKNLLEGVKEFIKIRLASGLADRITIIVFNDNANYAYFNEDIKSIDIKKISFTGGGTDFTKAFDMVIDVMQKVQSQSSTSGPSANLDFIIVFMSDGQANFPGSQLDTLLTMQTKINQFWTVALGDRERDILEKITEKMNGTFIELKDSAELVGVYAEIAQN